MKKLFKILLAGVVICSMILSAMPTAQAKKYDNKIEVKIAGFDVKTDNGYFFVYPN